MSLAEKVFSRLTRTPLNCSAGIAVTKTKRSAVARSATDVSLGIGFAVAISLRKTPVSVPLAENAVLPSKILTKLGCCRWESGSTLDGYSIRRATHRALFQANTR